MKDTWQGASQRTASFNERGDHAISYVDMSETLWLYIHSGESKESANRTTQMRRYSLMITEQMADQVIDGNAKQESRNGRSVRVRNRWTLSEQNEWQEAAEWLVEQCERLRMIVGGAGSSAEIG